MSSSLVVQGQGHSLEGNAGCPKQGWSLCEGRDHQRPHPPNPSCAQQTRGGFEVDLGGCALEIPSILEMAAG